MESSLLRSPTKETMEEENHSYKLVPWLSWDEWNFVRESLFSSSSSSDSIAAALTRISTWRSRGNLPTVIDVTASIIEIQQKDPFFREGLMTDALESEEMLAMLYCMAIMRLVNGVVDKNRNHREVSIAEEAYKIGLPRSLIDIRHEASHRDLPSLPLVRAASVKALDWIKSYYWERQKNAIPFQRDEIALVRKEIKSKLHELAFHLNMNQASQSSSLPRKRRRDKKSNGIYGRNNLFSHKLGKMKGFKSQGPKNQIKRIIRILVRLYSSFSSDVVSVLLDFLLRELDSLDCNAKDPSDNFEVESISGKSRTLTSITDIWKLVTIRLSSKKPELILIMLKEVLEMIEAREATKAEIGSEHLSGLQSKAEIRQIEKLSSLVLWLIENYNKVKRPRRIVREGEIQDSSAETNVVPKATLTEFLRKCLLVFCPGNNQLARSAMLLAQIMGNSSMVERLKKLSILNLPNLDCVEESSAHTDTESIIIQQESSISRAVEMLEFLKRNRTKGKAVNIEARNGDKIENVGRWTVAKSWNPCPIGMLPSALGSTGVLPILDSATNLPEVQTLPNGKTSDSRDVELLETTDGIEEGMGIEDGRAEYQDSLLEPFKGRLMIGGYWKKVRGEELHAIESAIRIIV